MTIAVAQSIVANASNAAETSRVTTSAVTTAATGSTFYATVVAYGAGGNIPGLTVLDSKGNTWTQIGTQLYQGGICASRFYVQNATGGSGHTFTGGSLIFDSNSNGNGTVTGTTTTMTDTSKSWTTNQWVGAQFNDTVTGNAATVSSNTSNTLTFPALGVTVGTGDGYTLNYSSIALFVLEITGAVTAGVLDQSNTAGAYTSSGATNATRFSSGNVTISSGNVTNGELLVSLVTNMDSSWTAWTEGNGFTIQAANNNAYGYPANMPAALATTVISTAGTYNAAWGDASAGNTNWISSIDSFIGAASGPTYFIMGQVCL